MVLASWDLSPHKEHLTSHLTATTYFRPNPKKQDRIMADANKDPGPVPPCDSRDAFCGPAPSAMDQGHDTS